MKTKICKKSKFMKEDSTIEFFLKDKEGLPYTAVIVVLLGLIAIKLYVAIRYGMFI